MGHHETQQKVAWNLASTECEIKSQKHVPQVRVSLKVSPDQRSNRFHIGY